MTANCKATLTYTDQTVTVHPNAHCGGYWLIMDKPTTKGWNHQVVTSSTQADTATVPACSRFQADYRANAPKSHAQNGDKVVVWMRGDNKQGCTAPVTTTTTVPKTVTTVGYGPHPTAVHTISYAHPTAAVAVPSSGLALTGSNVGPELGMASAALIFGALLLRCSKGARK
jgi:hypothetical protein